MCLKNFSVVLKAHLKGVCKQIRGTGGKNAGDNVGSYGAWDRQKYFSSSSRLNTQKGEKVSVSKLVKNCSSSRPKKRATSNRGRRLAYKAQGRVSSRMLKASVKNSPQCGRNFFAGTRKKKSYGSDQNEEKEQTIGREKERARACITSFEGKIKCESERSVLRRNPYEQSEEKEGGICATNQSTAYFGKERRKKKNERQKKLEQRVTCSRQERCCSNFGER